MNFLYVLILVSIHRALGRNAQTNIFGKSRQNARQNLDFMKLAKYDHYTAEEHLVTTEDGYILSVFRIPLKSNCRASNGTIVFMHGLALSSDDCLVPGPGKAHCYIYADNCYDVWAPNVRGNYYGRKHITYDPDKDSKFWDFSFDEMAMFDLPAIIDYVLGATNQTQVSYVGHSQGVALLLVLCSKRPEYNAKIKVGFGISPTAWLSHSRFIYVYFQSAVNPLLTLPGDLLLDIEVLPRKGLVQSTGKDLCGVPGVSYLICSTLIFGLLGYNKFQITRDVLPVVFGHIPSGTSLKNMARWGQIKNNGFSEYDYGNVKNRMVYGQMSPPMYDLNEVTMKWVLIGSINDYVGDIKDIKTLLSRLKNASLCVLADKTFGHLDFIFGKDIPKYITPIILSTLETDGYKCL